MPNMPGRCLLAADNGSIFGEDGLSTLGGSMHSMGLEHSPHWRADRAAVLGGGRKSSHGYQRAARAADEGFLVDEGAHEGSQHDVDEDAKANARADTRDNNARENAQDDARGDVQERMYAACSSTKGGHGGIGRACAESGHAAGVFSLGRAVDTAIATNEQVRVVETHHLSEVLQGAVEGGHHSQAAQLTQLAVAAPSNEALLEVKPSPDLGELPSLGGLAEAVSELLDMGDHLNSISDALDMGLGAEAPSPQWTRPQGVSLLLTAAEESPLPQSSHPEHSGRGAAKAIMLDD